MSIPIDFIVRQGLQVATNVVVGSYTLNVANPPTNGLIVSGNVGVGTSSPTQKLQVVGNIQISNTTSAISGIYFADGTFQTTSAASYSTPAGGPANSIQYNNGSGGFAGSNNFVFSSNYVGIGTNAPSRILDVQSSTSIATFATRTGQDYQIFVGNNSPSGNVAVLGYNPSGLYAYISTGAQNTPGLVVTQGNLVGIGTTVPVNTLDISGSVAVGEYAGIATAPVNGVAVSGSIGIGTSVTSGTGTGRLTVQQNTGQAAIGVLGTSGPFIQYSDAGGSTRFLINDQGNIIVGGWTGNVIAANYGGTGLISYAAGDLVYAASGGGIASLTRLPIGSTGNVLTVSGGLPTWGNVTVNDLYGVVPISSGGTNAAVFSGNAIVVTTANGLVMTSVTSSTNAAVVFTNSGVPSAVSGGPYTYLTTGSGGNLSFGKVDLVNGVTGTLTAPNGGTGQNTIGQYQLLVGGASNNWNLLSSSVTSALVTSVTGSPQWTSGSTGNTVLRSNGTSITFAQVQLTTDVTGILPYSNGGTNSAVNFTAGSVIFAGSTGFAQDNSNLFWDSTNRYLGIDTQTPTSALDVNGTATIRNGANVVAGGVYVQSGVGNFVGAVIADRISGNTSVFTPQLTVSNSANVQGLTSNTTVIISGTNPATSTSTGALTVGGGAGITGNLYVGGITNLAGNVFIGGNLIVAGNSTIINSSSLAIQDPVIDIGTAPNNAPLSTNDGHDKGLVIHYWDTTGIGDDHAVLVKQANNGPLIYATNVQPGVTNVANPFLSNSPGFDWGTMELGNIQLQSNLISTSTSTGALVLSGQGGIGLGGSINAGGNGYFAGQLNAGQAGIFNTLTSNSWIFAQRINVTSSVIADSISANSSIYTTNLNSSGPVVADRFVANTSIFAPTINLTGNLVANGISSNTFVNTQTLTATGNVRFTSTNASISTTTGALVLSGGIGVGGNIVTNGIIVNSANIALGFNSGVGQADKAIAIGNSAGAATQSAQAVAIGYSAASSGQGCNTVAIGTQAGKTCQSQQAVAIGYNAGQSSQGQCAVAVGYSAGGSGQHYGAVAIGPYAGAQSQFQNAVAVGSGAGSYSQGGYAVAIGENAGTANQGCFAVALGNGAGGSSQGSFSLALGYNAGSACQPANSIIMNAGSSALNGTQAGLYINPVRSCSSNTVQAVYYNTTTKELTYASPTVGYSNANVASYLSGPVVIGNLFISNSTTTTSAKTGALVSNGGIATNNNLWVTGSGWIGNLTILSTTNSTSASTGALVVDGGVGINGNLYVTGNIIGGNVAVIQGNSGVFYGNQFGFNALYAGIPIGYTVQPNTIEQLSANDNGYAQLNLQNINPGSGASGDIVVTADNGTATDTYIDMGINSSTFNAGSIDKPNDGYLQVYGNAITGGGNLILGTYLNNDIIFATGGDAPSNEVARLRNGQGLIISQYTDTISATTGSLVTNSGIAASGNLYINNAGWVGNLSITNSTASTSSTSGALVVAGGAGISGQLNVSGTVNTGGVYSGSDISAVGSVTASTIVSNSSVTGNSFVLNGNVAIISTTGTVTVDSFPVSAYRTIHYIAQVTDNTAIGQFHSEQLFIIHDGTTAYQTEWNMVYTVSPLGTFNSGITTGIFSLTFTPFSPTNKTIRIVRTGVNI